MEALKAHGIFAIRLNSGVTLLEHKGRKRAIRMMPKGTADILALRFALHLTPSLNAVRPVWLEVKTDKGKQSADQRAFELIVRAEGHDYAVVRSVEEALDEVR
jgi:hypothetical protein